MRQWHWYRTVMTCYFSIAFISVSSCYTVNPVFSGMKIIVIRFIMHYKKNKQAGCYSYCQPNNIDGRIEFVSRQVTQDNPEVVADHGSRLQLDERGAKFVTRSRELNIQHGTQDNQ